MSTILSNTQLDTTPLPSRLDAALEPHIRLVRLHAEAALVERLNAGYGFADTRIPGEMFLRNPEARERLSRGSLRPENTHIVQTHELAEAIAETRGALETHVSPLTEISARFALNPAEHALLAIAVAYELDADVRDLCHGLAWRRHSALFADVCQELAPELAPTSVLLSALHPSGALSRGCLIEIESERKSVMPARATASAALTVSRRVLDWLMGDQRIAEPLHAVVRIHEPSQDFHVHIEDALVTEIERTAERLQRALEAARATGSPIPAILICGPLGAGKKAVAHRLAARLGRPLAAIPITELVSVHERLGERTLARQALAEARLRHAIPYLPGIERLRASGDEGDHTRHILLDAMEQHTDALILGTSERGQPSIPFSRPFLLIRLPQPSLEVRQAAWTTGLAALADLAAQDTDLSPSTASELAARYVIGPGTIGEVVDEARVFARATSAPVQLGSIEDAVARRLTLRLGSFGTLITRRARLEEMVLPEDVIETISDMIAMVRERTQILERWGYGKHLGLSRGVSALFSGEPGTGKTMAASVISSALGLELIRIDLAAVTSKWVGETEKHLAKIFDEAQTANAMLLFDEADSLFGKRTEAKSAQDRYANMEINYVLQRMESFDGISVLTTNLESAIDTAFMRRLNFRVRFPKPEVDERMELWRRLLPPETGLGGTVNFTMLAEKFDMTGGHIRNAIVRAAVIAAREGRAMQAKDLIAGAHLEYIEMGKVMPSLV